jgi:NAD(P)-dependent dehydrogenase (short-subunit alcohol dehydrogenase family)
MAPSTGTVLITGANGGLGSAFVAGFLKSPYAATHTGLFAVRNPSTATTLQKIVTSAAGPDSRHEIISLDISTLASVRAGAQAINGRVASGALPPIRALILNAAVQHLKGQTFTNDGLESNFSINYLSNFLLVLLLLQSMDTGCGRIVIVASWTHDPLDTRNFHIKEDAHKTIFRDVDSLAKPSIAREKGEWDLCNAGLRRYGMSKTLMVMFM